MRIRHVKGAEEALTADPLVINEPEKHKGNWGADIFHGPGPLFVEIGTGMGIFLRTLSLRRPENNYIGIELNATVLYKAVKRRRAEEDSGNLRFIWGNARFLTEYFAESEISGIYLNFSDPWPKKRSAGRRLTAPQYLKLYRETLRPGGKIEFKTDNRDFFEYSIGTLNSNGWKITELTFDLLHDPAMSADNIMTEYEEKFSAKGNPIYKLTAL